MYLAATTLDHFLSALFLYNIAPSSSPRSVVISAVTSTGFLVSWSAPPMVDHNGNIRSYLINVTEEDTGASVEFRSSAHSVRVESRHPFYNYTCVVAAVTVAAGPFSTPSTVATLEDGMIILILEYSGFHFHRKCTVGMCCQ